MAGKLNGFSVAYTVIGGILLWSGIKGASLSTSIQDLLKGQPITQNEENVGVPQLNILDNAGGGSGSGSAPTGSSSQFVSDAQKYLGDKYVWGGTPGTTVGKNNGTDCSGFVNMVVGRDLGMAIPGYKAGQYKGATHGPVTGEWLLWGGAKTVPLAQAQAGDLACWQTHIGFFTDNGKNVLSALGTKEGVTTASLAGSSPPGEKLFVRRIGG